VGNNIDVWIVTRMKIYENLYSLSMVEENEKKIKYEKINNKSVGDWISAPSRYFVAMAARVGPQHFAWFH